MVEIRPNSLKSFGAEINVTVSDPSVMFHAVEDASQSALFCVGLKDYFTVSCQLYPSSEHLGFWGSPIHLEFLFWDSMNCSFEERELDFSSTIRDIETGMFREKEALCLLNRDFASEEG